MVAGGGGFVRNMGKAGVEAILFRGLTKTESGAVAKVLNIMKNNFKLSDITGAVRDMIGNPVIKGGKLYQHAEDLGNTLRGLRNAAETLKGVNNPEARQAYNIAIETIKAIEDATKGAGL